MKLPHHDLPDSMTVIDIIEPGGPEKLQPLNVILPPITSGHLLVKVMAAGLIAQMYFSVKAHIHRHLMHPRSPD